MKMPKCYQYKCKTCSHEEIVWNFIPTTCWVCGGKTLLFCDLTASVRVKNHCPNQQVFSASFADAIRCTKEGFFHYQQGNFEKAMVQYNQAIRLYSELAGAYNNRGELRYYQGNVEGAIADYNQAIFLTPDNPLVYLRRGLARNQLGDLVGANQDYYLAINAINDLHI